MQAKTLNPSTISEFNYSPQVEPSGDSSFWCDSAFVKPTMEAAIGGILKSARGSIIDGFG